ncbi:Alpha amylase, catalytic domain containing protein [Histomonas meleagridis]|uniref:Alpha amylase, catalytic domain containing protein n=1 Tax=Histomonas meleagridis TaxID=135588 RepID=UPI003559838F|nr:Alpha amylase, catalytic domain containing protein [Histomonas meleagridis]KAH0800669.1 Alpha amylase, catalytic domain containing protein [Histomonas meleagridis]
MIDSENSSDSDLKIATGNRKKIIIGVAIAAVAVVVVVAIVLIVVLVPGDDDEESTKPPTPSRSPTQSPSPSYSPYPTMPPTSTPVPNDEDFDTSKFNDIRIYQIYVAAFQGDCSGGVCFGEGYGPSDSRGNLQGIINSLDYIQDLGFNGIWLTPIFDSRDGYGGIRLQSTGYYATDYFNIDPRFGTTDDLKKLVEEAHKRNIYVFLDGVLGHNGNFVKVSPEGNYPIPVEFADPTIERVTYPDSLPFYREFVRYWIENYQIDGWRFDMTQQLRYKGSTHNHNYWQEIRREVEHVCNQRKARGEQWGILGYMFAENWASDAEIYDNVINLNGLYSALDFQGRYRIVKSLATQEDPNYTPTPFDDLKATYIMSSAYDNGHAAGRDIYLNLFITNHDIYRYGDLVRLKYNIGQKNDTYWQLHKLALAIMTSRTGPITIYYGDEIGQMAGCTASSSDPCDKLYNTTKYIIGTDNVARTNGKITGFTDKEQELHDYTKKLLSIRHQYDALYNYTVKDLGISIQNPSGILGVKKYGSDQKLIVVLINYEDTEKTITGFRSIVEEFKDATTLKDLITETQFTGTAGEDNDNINSLKIGAFSALYLINPQ